ncbi:S-layer homology domain-containing protein [Oscillospiraceae bacterium 50-58]
MQTYKGDTLTKDFTASDTITVKATPTATGQAPAKAAARLRGDPTAGQMVVFVGDTQVCAPADVGADGSYTMNVSAADVLVAAGGPGTGITLTAKFVGNDNMADGAGTVDVSISAVAKIENGSTTTYVGNLDDAFKTENDGATITLLKDVTRTPVLDIHITCNLDLGGHTITCTGGTAVSTFGQANVTIQGAGEVVSASGTALDVGGNVTLKGGTFTGGGSQSAGVNVNDESGSLSVAENVTIQNTGGGYGLAVSNAQSVQLSGGKYSGTAGAIVIVSQSSSLTLGGLLAHSGDTRYAYFDESGTTPFTGVLGNKSLTGTVTVKKCNHTVEGVCEYTPNEGAETHAMTCLACGYAGAAEDCQYTYTPDSGGEHHITACQFCGRTKTEAHTYGSWTPEHNENAVTIRRSCENCGYTKTDGTFTAPAHGQTMQYGKPITLTCSSTLPGATFSWSLNGSTAEGTGASFTLPETLAVGSYLYDVTVKWPGSESNICTKTVIFEVTPAPLTATGATAEGRAYDGTNSVEITGVTLAGILNGDDVSVDTTGLTGTLNGSNAGTYTNLTLPAMTLTGADAENYTVTRPAGAVPASVTIRKAAPLTPKTGDLAVANKQEHTYTYGLGALRPDVQEGMSLGSTAVTYELGPVNLGSYYDSGAMIDGQTLTLPIKAVESDSETKIGTITVTIHTQNFEDMTATIDVRSVNKIIPTGEPTLSGTTLTYGQSLSAITLRGDMADGTTPVPGTFAWSNPDNRPAVQENYAAAWVFTPDDNGKYAIVNGTALVQVLPAPIAGAVIVLEPAAFRYDGAAHSPSITSVTLNGTPLTADVDYTAAIPEGTEAGTYTVTLTGKGNYTGTATAVFIINPVEQKPLDQKDDNGHELRLEVETGLSTVPEALKTNEQFNTPGKIETALRTRVAEVMSNVGEQIAVFDVTLQYKDESGVWRNVDPNHFPAEGVTAVLPYPAGTGATGYTFTVQHLISSGPQAGTMETLPYELTADGLRCKFSSLSPVAIGYQTATKPNPQPNPGGNSGGGSGGGGWSSSTYAITVEKSEHGKVTSNRTNASNGSTVTLTVTPDSGYVLDALTVTDSRGNEIKLTAQGGGKYTFTMPSRAVTVKATFAPLPDDTQKPCDGGENCPSRGFTDLGGVGMWYHEAVDYVLRNGLMNGYSNGTFGPNNNLTRAQFAQILFNKEGRPVVNYLLQYSDVANGAWYTEAIRWATSQGVVGGYGNGMFGPNDNITREQLAVMLWRYAGSPAATDKELHFTDVDKASGYALEALRWAVENGIINGYGDGRLGPQGLATRGQVAQMLKNFLGK